MEESRTNFLGRGWGFPPTFNLQKGGVEMTADDEDIRKSLEILLATSIGERVMRPDYGANMDSLVFEPLDNTLKNVLVSNIKDSIYLHEPRIIPDEIQLEEDVANGIVYVKVEYTIPSVNSRRNFVYPFYIQEVTN